MNKNLILPWLDAFRFIAAFLVLMSHTRTDYFIEYELLPPEQQNIGTMLFYFFGRLGHEAVIAFFVLSGFLVGGKLIERLKKNTFNIKSYTIDRTVRIGIPLVAAIIYCYIVSLFADGCYFDLRTALGNLFNLQGILVAPLVPPFWSLNYEVWFYVIAGALALIMSNKQSPTTHLWGFVLFTICVLVFLKLNTHYLFIWIMGAFAYVIPYRGRKSKIKLITLPLIILLLCALSMTQSGTNTNFVNFKFDRHIIEVFLAVAMCSFIRQIILYQPNGRWIKVNNFFTNMAKFSYTLYLTHMITEYWVFDFFLERNSGYVDIKGIFIWILLMGVCLLVSYIIYCFSEKHTAFIKKVIKERLNYE